MDIRLDKVKLEEKNILFRLLQYSLFEESLTDLNEMNSKGLFEYKWFESYFNDDRRFAFFVREQSTNKLLGFVMINDFVQVVTEGHSIAEFLVIPKYRKQGIGKKVAYECFEMFEGDWEIKPSFNNSNAFKFWQRVVSEYTNQDYEYIKDIFIFKSYKNKKDAE
jgi:predicted acetyltransferase